MGKRGGHFPKTGLFWPGSRPSIFTGNGFLRILKKLIFSPKGRGQEYLGYLFNLGKRVEKKKKKTKGNFTKGLELKKLLPKKKNIYKDKTREKKAHL